MPCLTASSTKVGPCLLLENHTPDKNSARLTLELALADFGGWRMTFFSGGRLSLRQVSIKLTAQGYLNERGKPYAAKSVANMLV